MTLIYFNLFLFVAAIVVFALYAFKSYQVIDSPKSFFYKKGLPANVISLTAANITLGTGLAYVIQGGQQNGILMLLVPLMVGLGYYLLAQFITRYVASDVLEGANFIYAINDKISNQTGSPSHFSILVSISLIATYTLILPFEIFASSKIITPFLVQGGGVVPQVILSLIIFFVALGYVLFGGIRAVFATDRLQLIAIILFLFALAYIAFSGLISSSPTPVSVFENALKFDTHIIFAVIAACIAAVSTQFYSLLNWGYISHMEKKNRGLLLKRVGVFATLLLILMTSFGVFYSAKEGTDIITDLMSLFTQGSIASGKFIWIIAGLSILGMTSIVFSTIDSLIIKVIMFFYQNIAKRDSRSSKKNPAELKLIRRIVFFTFGAIFLILGYLNFIQPNVFYLLLAIVAGVNIFAPMLATAGYLSYKGTLSVFSPSVVWGYFILFIIVGVISISIFLSKPMLLGWVGTFAFVASSLYSGLVIMAASKHRLMKK